MVGRGFGDDGSSTKEAEQPRGSFKSDEDVAGKMDQAAVGGALVGVEVVGGGWLGHERARA